MPSALSSRIVRAPREFDGLRPAWDGLCDDDRFRAPFYSWLWQSLWWKHFGRGKSLFVVVVEDDRRQIVGIAPLMKHRRSIRGLPVTELAFAANPLTPRSAILASPRFPAAVVAEEALRCLAAHRGEWDLATLTNIDASLLSPAAVLQCCRQRGLAAIQTPGRSSPFAAIAGGFDAYWAGKFNSKRRGNIRRSLQMLNERGAYRVVDYTASDGMEAALRWAFQVSANSWKGRIGSHMNGSRVREAFYRDITASLAAKGQVRIWIAFLDSRPVAVQYYMTCGKRLYFLVNDFDQRHERLSPGTVLLYKVLERLHEEGRIEELDFGGEAYGYKLKWATGIRPHASFELFNSCPYSKFLHLTKSVLLPNLRRLRRRLAPAAEPSPQG
jgi:CelD/BcsL family acetyltransferase involved in cellulose biosynthesis